MLGVSFEGAIADSALKQFSNSELLKKSFEESMPLMEAKFTVSEEETNSVLSQEGLLFKNAEPNNRVLQIKVGSLLFHVLNKYEPLDKLIKELSAYWGELTTQAEAISVSNVYIRYLNFIPMAENSSINEYVTLYPSHPFGAFATDSFTSLQLKLDGVDVDIVSTKGEIDNEQGVVLDFTMRKATANNLAEMLVTFKQLSALKNTVFFNSITPKTVKMYQL